ncbi:hypothetical protein NVS89_19425 [Ancylobacter sp. MQZ15Z-1]|uniref:Uncharacterized protein n=1 Tax=Ancylobacter mangrovi TaxID=2972472 RepID=A0A9X2PP45_9HYPH|nr:hypothetical protein [Ancylobacter mangrovi]MCS0497263.1 hypothetical protein [Ancylobacter mangrovi]
MIVCAPERIIIAHDRWYDRGGGAGLKRTFRRVLRATPPLERVVGRPVTRS